MRDGVNVKDGPYDSVIQMTPLSPESLLEVALDAGADQLGVTTADPFIDSKQTMDRMVLSGMSGNLRFTYTDTSISTDVAKSFPWARSLIVLTKSYAATTSREQATGPVIARFVQDDGYAPLRQAASTVGEALKAGGHRAEILSDDNRLVDRSAAARAGLGWMGKSTMMLNQTLGPWFLIGSVITDAVLPVSPTVIRSCGTCSACLPACPTGAISESGVDARRCISAWLQSPGSLPRWIRPHIGRRIYGCDDCLTACPPGQKAAGLETGETLTFSELLDHSDQELIDRFHWWYVPRRDGRFIRRNLIVAAGNSGEQQALDSVRDHLAHSSGLIRGHAAWAWARGMGADGLTELRSRLDAETVPEVIDELDFAVKSAQ